MNWRDFFYFSKGERLALTVLTGLIAAAWTTLLLTDSPQTTTNTIIEGQQQPIHVNDPTVTAQLDTSTKVTITAARPKQERPSRKKQLFQQKYPKQQKYPEGTVIELNRADSTQLKMVPGIGNTFSQRIVKFRKLLGGFYDVSQLQEVYGMDYERYEDLKRWFKVDASLINKLEVNKCSIKELSAHPYINYQQAKTIKRLVKQKKRLIGWENLQLLEEFTEADRARLLPYLSFE